jgi:dynein heavy chain
MIEHLSRVSRMIQKPYGNGLLVGLGGNGRRSLTRLAAQINECSIFKIELNKIYGKNEWADDLRNFTRMMGVENKATVFMFADQDIKTDIQIEDINNLLNIGEVPNLHGADEIEDIKYEMQKMIKEKEGKKDLWQLFNERCKKNMHIVLFMSPAG